MIKRLFDAVLDRRGGVAMIAAIFVPVILVIGWSARALNVGFALPVLGLIVVALVLLDRLAPTLHRAVDDPSTPSLA